MDDIPPLAKHFVDVSVRELKCATPRLTRAGVAKLQSYNWPGNVRELRNVIERAVILARGGPLEFDLPVTAQLAPPPRPGSRVESRETEVPQPEFFTEVELQRRERENLLGILEKANWKIKGPGGAAELLGVKPTSLLSRMNKWGISKPAPEARRFLPITCRVFQAVGVGGLVASAAGFSGGFTVLPLAFLGGRNANSNPILPSLPTTK